MPARRSASWPRSCAASTIQLLDRNLIGHIPLIGGGLSLLVSDGVYRGAYLEHLVADRLAEFGVRTFGDLRTGESPTSSPGR